MKDANFFSFNIFYQKLVEPKDEEPMLAVGQLY